MMPAANTGIQIREREKESKPAKEKFGIAKKK